MSNTLLFVTMVAITLFNISAYVFIMVRFTETQKLIEELSSKQFDAEQVMSLYQQKFVKPIIYQDRADVKELRYDIRLPYDHLKMMGSEEEMIDQVKKDIAKEYATNLMPFIDYQIDNDVVRFEKVFRSRLRVVSRNS